MQYVTVAEFVRLRLRLQQIALGRELPATDLQRARPWTLPVRSAPLPEASSTGFFFRTSRRKEVLRRNIRSARRLD